MNKKQEWTWDENRQKEFEGLKEDIGKIPTLSHFNPNQKNIITTDASTHGLGAILWQEQKDKTLKPISFASRFLNDAEKNTR